MAKEIHLIYNNIRQLYVFYEGKTNQYNRDEISGVLTEGELVRKLKSKIDIKRKSVLVLESVPESLELKIRKTYEKTKVKVK